MTVRIDLDRIRRRLEDRRRAKAAREAALRAHGVAILPTAPIRLRQLRERARLLLFRRRT